MPTVGTLQILVEAEVRGAIAALKSVNAESRNLTREMQGRGQAMSGFLRAQLDMAKGTREEGAARKELIGHLRTQQTFYASQVDYKKQSGDWTKYEISNATKAVQVEKQILDLKRQQSAAARIHITDLRQLGYTLAATGGLVVAGLVKVAQAAGEDEDAYRRLEDAARASGRAMDVPALAALADQRQLVTRYTDEETQAMQALLMTYRFNQAQIEALTPRIQNLAATYHKDLNPTAIAVGKAFDGNATALKRFGIILPKNTDLSRDFGQSLLLLDRYGGNMAETMGSTVPGQLVILRNQMDETKEALGKALTPEIVKWTEKLIAASAATREWIDLHPETVRALAKDAAGFAAVAVPVGGLLIALPTLAKDYEILRAAMTTANIAAYGPWLIVAAELGILTAEVWNMTDSWREAARSVRQYNDAIAGAVERGVIAPPKAPSAERQAVIRRASEWGTDAKMTPEEKRWHEWMEAGQPIRPYMIPGAKYGARTPPAAPRPQVNLGALTVPTAGRGGGRPAPTAQEIARQYQELLRSRLELAKATGDEEVIRARTNALLAWELKAAEKFKKDEIFRNQLLTDRARLLKEMPPSVAQLDKAFAGINDPANWAFTDKVPSDFVENMNRALLGADLDAAFAGINDPAKWSFVDDVPSGFAENMNRALHEAELDLAFAGINDPANWEFTDKVPSDFQAKMDAQLQGLLPKVSTWAADMSAIMADWEKDFTDTIVEGVTAGKLAFTDFADTVIQQMYRMMTQRYITEPIFNYLTSLLPGIAAKRQMGGPVVAGRGYVVGERGPEMIIPRTPGYVIPNAALGGRGGIVVNQTLNIASDVAEGVRRQWMALRGQIRRDAVDAVLEGVERGGSYARALGRRR